MHDKKVYPDITPELFEPCVAWSYVMLEGGNARGGCSTIINIVTPPIRPESIFHNLAAFLGPKPLLRHECKLKERVDWQIWWGLRTCVFLCVLDHQVFLTKSRPSAQKLQPRLLTLFRSYWSVDFDSKCSCAATGHTRDGSKYFILLRLSDTLYQFPVPIPGVLLRV